MSFKRPVLWLGPVVILWLFSAWYAHRQFLPYDVSNTDIGTYLFQAQTFAEGKLWRSTPEPRLFFQQWQAIVRDRSFAYYPPAHALLLAPLMRWGWDPWLVPWIASGFCLIVIYVWGVRLLGGASAMAAAAFMAISPMFAANAPSLLSHSTALLETLLFLWAVICWRQDGKARAPLFSGLMLAFLFANRPANTAALGIVWIPWVLWTRRTTWKQDRFAWITFSTGILLIMLPLLFYYRALGGHWCLDLFKEYWPRNQFGFGTNLGRGEPGHYFQTYANHDWAGMLNNWRYSFVALNQWWTGNLYLSILLFVGFFILLGSMRRNGAMARNGLPKPAFPFSNFLPLLLWPLAHIFIYSLYFTPSTAVSGPRYLTEILPALALVSGWTICGLNSKTAKWVGLAVVLLAAACSVAFKSDFYLRNARGIAARRQVQEYVLQETRKPALVFLRSFWLGHPFPIFLNSPSLADPILFACDRGSEDKELVALHPHRNAYILAFTLSRGNSVQIKLIPIYDAVSQRWIAEPDRIRAPFFVGSKFTPPLELKGENARRLFQPKPEEIVPQ